MNKRLSVEGQLSVEDLERHSRQAREGVGRSQWPIVWLVAQGRACPEVAAQKTGYSVPWVREIVHRSTRQGPAGIGDRRHAHPGQSGLLAKEQQAELAQALEGPSPAGGRWSGPQAGGRVEEPALGPHGLAAAGLGAPTAAGLHAASAPAAARHSGWTGAGSVQGGALEAAIGAVRQAHPDDQLEIWGSDAHRVGRKPILRWVWARRGQRGVVAVPPLPVDLARRLRAAAFRPDLVACAPHRARRPVQHGAGPVRPSGRGRAGETGARAARSGRLAPQRPGAGARQAPCGLAAALLARGAASRALVAVGG